MNRGSRVWLGVCIATQALLGPAAHAQSTLERTPNLSGGWVGTGGRLDFHFVHRFNQSGAPQRQVQNRPTFTMAWELPRGVLLGSSYSTRSALAASIPNEWEPFVRVRALTRPADVALHLAYNNAARSADAEVSVARTLGPLRPILALRYLGSDGDADGSAFVTAAGGVLRLHSNVGLAVDAGRRFSDADDDRVFWGAGVQLQIPHTPHTLSLQATNTDALTLQSASRAAGRVRWGFEFTVPVTPARYFGSGSAVAVADTGSIITLHNLQFTPARITVRSGTTVQWRNADPVVHTVTAADGSWDSGPIEPGATWSRRFDTPGTWAIVCTPHPFMKVEVVVR